MARTVKAPSARPASKRTRRLFSKRERMIENEFYHYDYNTGTLGMTDSLIDLCSAPLHPQAAEGLRLFNAGKYFEAHEALEDAWNEEAGPVRDLYRGVLQIAVVYL